MPLSLVKLFIETVPEILTQEDERGYSLLHRAIEAHVPENIITYFLEKGINPDLPTQSKPPLHPLSPLDIACSTYEPHLPSAFAVLIKAGARMVTPQLALQFYKKLMSSRSFLSSSSNKEGVSSYETLLSSFLTLLERSQQLAWEFSLFHLLPEADKKPGDVVIRTPDSKTRILPPNLQKQLFDQNLRLIRRNKEGKRDVGIIEKTVHGVPLRFYVKE
jgi:ankyrin repeat protein